ncbi:ATPase, P-type (transporting), HAD superfamily, subfamily IC [Streptomyces sp. DI166]|nr:ATPase, P-type (transporting), HAD superfamily, subfamily IC [Streptomyces sp. DI166]
MSAYNERAARHLAAQVGITDVRAGLLPQDKVVTVRELEDQGRRGLVVGHGVNDAPALAAAHTGIAMGKASSDLALETAADAVVVRDELATIPTVVVLACPSGELARGRRQNHDRRAGWSTTASRNRRARAFPTALPRR